MTCIVITAFRAPPLLPVLVSPLSALSPVLRVLHGLGASSEQEEHPAAHRPKAEERWLRLHRCSLHGGWMGWKACVDKASREREREGKRERG